jgi:hypothetical protein
MSSQPPSVSGTPLVIERATFHRTELRANWDRAREGLPVILIDPFE